MRMLLLSLSSGLFLAAFVRADEWTPPENADPSAIMQEAAADSDAGHYEVALAKQVWYHENATKLQPAQSGVRLSFALSNWLELGEKYPPALEKLIEIRDRTEETIRDENRIRVRVEDFQDFTAINKILRQEERTVEVFKWLSEASEEDARKMYGISKAALIKHQEYDLCGKYVDAEADVERIGESYALGLTMKNRFGKAHHDFVEKKFVNDSATLVAILVKTDRVDEAKEAAKKLKGVVTDAKLSKKLKRELDAALDGTVPAPWP